MRAWRDVSPFRRCPVCEGKSWCQVHCDGDVVLCKRVASERERATRDGTVFWVHRADGRPLAPAEPPPPVVCADRAPPELLDEVYRALLVRLPFTDAHRAALERRGLARAAIAAGGYRTLPREGRGAVARALRGRFGARALAVPGVVLRDGTTWSLGGWAGLVIPVRDLEGRVVALKVRADDTADAAQRYTYVSSARHGGPSALPALHVPRARPAAGGVVRITEGELKADVATALSGIPTLSVPGVGMWRLALPALARLAPARVLVAYDRDAADNPHVARALRDLVAALQAAGYRGAIERWRAELGKGIDDMLAARERGRTAA